MSVSVGTGAGVYVAVWARRLLFVTVISQIDVPSAPLPVVVLFGHVLVLLFSAFVAHPTHRSKLDPLIWQLPVYLTVSRPDSCPDARFAVNHCGHHVSDSAELGMTIRVTFLRSLQPKSWYCH